MVIIKKEVKTSNFNLFMHCFDLFSPSRSCKLMIAESTSQNIRFAAPLKFFLLAIREYYFVEENPKCTTTWMLWGV